MDNEIWKPIEKTNGDYSVSNLGRVRNNTRKIVGKDGKNYHAKEHVLKTASDLTGYQRCATRSVGTMKVHREVAIAFIPNPDNLPEINHKDGNKKNNSIDNLEWVSHQQNCKHAHENGLVKHISKYSQSIIDEIRKRYVKGSRTDGSNALSREYGIDSSYIWRIVNGYKRQLKGGEG